MRVLVTGGTGFVGRILIRRLVERGDQVFALLRPGHDRPPVSFDGLRWIRGDLERVPWVEIQSEGVETLVHLAWIATPGVYVQSPLNEQYQRWSCDLLMRAAEVGVKRVVALGTCAEYAASDEVLKESSPVAPGSPYAQAKVALHDWIRSHAGELGLSWAWCRLFYPYGVGEHADRLPSSIVRTLLRGEKMGLQMPHAVRDYVHVEDVASALELLVDGRLEGVVNVGSGDGVKVGWIALLLARMLGEGGWAQELESVLSHSPEGVSKVVADVSRLKGVGWVPQVGLEEGLSGLVQYLRGA